MKIYGLDLSLDHCAVVTLDKQGKGINYLYTTTSKKMAEADSKHSFLLSKKVKDESKDTFRLRRMNEIAEVLLMFLIHNNDFDKFFHDITSSAYFSIEGYAYASQTTSICQIAELTGFLKQKIFEGGGNIRIHDPLTVKLFAVNTGKCLKKDIVEAAQKVFDIPECLIKRKKKKIKGIKSKVKGKVKSQIDIIEEFDGPATDVADAYFLAKMVQVELKLRRGEVTIAELSENERRIFLRVTKAYPVNILARSFICKE